MSKRNKKALSFIAVLILLVFISVFISFLFGGWDYFKAFPKHTSGTIYGLAVGLTFWWGNFGLSRVVRHKLNWKRRPHNSNYIGLLLFIVFGIVASILVPFVYYGHIINVSPERLWGTVLTNGFINLSVDMVLVAVFYTHYLVKRQIEDMKHIEELKRENLLANYEALKNQVNPHFLFNSLNTLAGVVEKDQAKAIEFIKKLSDNYRYVLDKGNKELVPIRQELKFVDDYIFLQSIRHGKGLSYKAALTSKTIFVLPLAMQLLVENAIKHNEASDNKPLNIQIFDDKEYIYVQNNRHPKTIVQKEHPIGLENLKNRYSYLTDLPVEVIEDTVSFIVKIPILEKLTTIN